MSIKDPYCCSSCGAKFSSLVLFDWHRTGDYTNEHPHYGRSCRDDQQLLNRGAKNVNGVWKMPMTESQAASLETLKARRNAKF